MVSIILLCRHVIRHVVRNSSDMSCRTLFYILKLEIKKQPHVSILLIQHKVSYSGSCATSIMTCFAMAGQEKKSIGRRRGSSACWIQSRACQSGTLGTARGSKDAFVGMRSRHTQCSCSNQIISQSDECHTPLMPFV